MSQVTPEIVSVPAENVQLLQVNSCVLVWFPPVIATCFVGLAVAHQFVVGTV
ncbi:MAG: hypothetical protein LBQ59_03160 [Candidatus Peribacteria bacterium]|nr:hypothetical protein [Candidatus Peribacteria bacterium]